MRSSFPWAAALALVASGLLAPLRAPTGGARPLPDRSAEELGFQPFDHRSWLLRVGGDVEQPLIAASDDARRLPSRLIVRRGPDRPGAPAETALWEGVHPNELVRRVRPRQGVDTVVLVAGDGTRTRLALDEFLMPRTVLAYRRDDRLLWGWQGTYVCCLPDDPARPPIASIVGVEFLRSTASRSGSGASDSREGATP